MSGDKDNALLALKAQVRASMAGNVKAPSASLASASRSVFVSCESGATIDQCRSAFETCGSIVRIDSMLTQKSLFRIEFESESSIEKALRVQLPSYIVVKCSSGSAKASSLPSRSPPRSDDLEDGEELSSDKEEGELSDTEDDVVMADLEPPREKIYNPRPQMMVQRWRPDHTLLPPDPYTRRLSQEADAPVFHRYLVEAPYLGRQRMALPSEIPTFFYRYPPILHPTPTIIQRSPQPHPRADHSPQLRQPLQPDLRIHHTPQEIYPAHLPPRPPSVPLLPPPQPAKEQQPDKSEIMIAELKRKALMSKGREGPRKKSARTSETSSPSPIDDEKLRTTTSQVANEAARFLMTVVNSAPQPDGFVAFKSPDQSRTPVTAATMTSRRVMRKPVARKPQDTFIIHLDDDDDDDDDSEVDSNDVVVKKQDANDLHRIKTSMEKLRQKIAAAEAANMNDTISESKDDLVAAKPLSTDTQMVEAPTKPTEMSKKSTIALISVEAKPKLMEPKPRDPSPPRAIKQLLQTRAVAITKLKDQIGSLEKRRSLLMTRRSIMEAQSSRLKQMIDRSTKEIDEAQVELGRHKQEAELLNKTLRNHLQSTPSFEIHLQQQPQLNNTLKQQVSPSDVCDSRASLRPLSPSDSINEEILLLDNTVQEPSSPSKESLTTEAVPVPISAPSSGQLSAPSLLMDQFRYESPLICLRSSSNSPTTTIDPNATLCQFSLFGQCNDDDCQMIHLPATRDQTKGEQSMTRGENTTTKDEQDGKTTTNEYISLRDQEEVVAADPPPDRYFIG